MKINKKTPPNTIKNSLVYRLSADEKNAEYAAKLNGLDDNEYKRKTYVRLICKMAAMLCVAVAVAFAALVGRQLLRNRHVAVGEGGRDINYIFIDGVLVGSAEDGEFFENNASRFFTFAEILANDCLYNYEGKKITHIFVPTEGYDGIAFGEAESYADRLSEYVTNESISDGYLVFEFPTEFSEEDQNIPFLNSRCLFAFEGSEYASESDTSGALVTSKKTEELRNDYMQQATDSDITALKGVLDTLCPNGYEMGVEIYAYEEDFDGDGKPERLINTESVYNVENPYSVIIMTDDTGEAEVIKSSAGNEPSDITRYVIYFIGDLNSDGYPEITVAESREGVFEDLTVRIYTSNSDGVIYEAISEAIR